MTPFYKAYLLGIPVIMLTLAGVQLRCAIMKRPYQLSRKLRYKPSDHGHQVLVRVRGLTNSDIEIPVRHYVGNTFMTISVKKEHWNRGYVTGGNYHISMRDLNLLLARVEENVRDAVNMLLSQKAKISYESVLHMTYLYYEKAIIDEERIRKGDLIVREDGGAFESKEDFEEFVERSDDPTYDELKRQMGIWKRTNILDYWDEYMHDYAPDENRVARPSIQKYIERTGDNCKVKDFDSHWLKRYFTDLVDNGYVTTKKGEETKHSYEVSTVEKYHKILRNFGKWLFEEKKLIDTEDYKRFKLRNPKSKKASILKIDPNPYKNNHALLKTEFDHLFYFQFKSKGDELIRDLFVLQTWFGGLRKSDFFDLTKDNITISGEEVQVEFEQQKTDTKVVNMANKNYVTDILLKYGNQLPQFPSSNKYNIRLKKVFEKAGLDRKLAFRTEPANASKAVTEYIRMHEKVSNKWARNCAVSLLVQEGYNDHYIKEFTGHSDEKMLRHYRDIHKTKVKAMLYEVKPVKVDDGL